MLKLYFKDNTVEAGIDEAGRGCLAGPVTAAAVILPSDFCCPMLNDSKKISPSKRYELREIIEDKCIAYAVRHISNKKIDDLNILNATYLAMHECVNKLTLKPDLLLIDGNRFINNSKIPHQCFIKGDGVYQSIAAASILAKTYRDDFMQEIHQQYPDYNWKKNKGYPTKEHKEAIIKHKLTPYHRRSFNLGIQLKLFN